MTTLHTTFSQVFRERLLDVLYDQWTDLGAAFSTSATRNEDEVIDPEALLWCSLEFVPTEPRLLEAVYAWLRVRGHYIIRQRLKSRTESSDPRWVIWEAFERTASEDDQSPSRRSAGPSPAPHVREVLDRIARLHDSAGEDVKPLGRTAQGASTLQLRARDLLGNDTRQFLLLYLLATPHGARLRDICEWAGYSYRSIFEVASRWESAEVVSLDHGYCRLAEPEPWQALLRCRANSYLLVDWCRVFGSGVELLRALARAEERHLGWDSAVVSRLCLDALAGLRRPLAMGLSGDAPTAASLRDLFPGTDVKR